MALKGDCEQIADRAMRILALIRVRQLTKLDLEENPDLTVAVTPEIRQGWNAKVDALQAEIKAIVSAWT